VAFPKGGWLSGEFNRGARGARGNPRENIWRVNSERFSLGECSTRSHVRRFFTLLAALFYLSNGSRHSDRVGDVRNLAGAERSRELTLMRLARARRRILLRALARSGCAWVSLSLSRTLTRILKAYRMPFALRP